MKCMRVVIVGVLVLIMFMFVHSQSPSTAPQMSRTITESAESQPARAKKLLVKKLPEGLEGIILEEGQFKLKPGYKFLPQTNSKVTIALMAGGHSVKGSFDCFCPKQGGGSCSAVTVGGIISCQPSKTTPCGDSCMLRTTIDGYRTKLAMF